MNALNLRDAHGIVHRTLDVLITDCLLTIEPGWTFDESVLSCLDCLATTGVVQDFATQIARAVAARAFTRCREEVHKTAVLKHGDTVDYKHDFSIRCHVTINEDGSVTVKVVP